MISSTLAVQNIVNDQREIMHNGRKPHPSIFVQNAYTGIKITAENTNLWIENSYVGKGWTISHDNIITGVPENNWDIILKAGQCVDIVPVGSQSYVVRPYNIDDKFAGAAQQTPMFPVLDDIAEMGKVLADMLAGNANLDAYKLMSAEEISNEANLVRLVKQRNHFCKGNWKAIADNYEHSVFYQLDLDHAAHQFAANGIEEPKAISDKAPLLTRIHDAMFRSELARLSNNEYKSEEQKAFALLREGLTEPVLAESSRLRCRSTLTK
jgi:hypothetical protein